MRRTYRVAAVVLSAALCLTACSPAPTAGPEIGWRDLVTRAAEQAAAGDYAGADSTLSGIEQDVAAARDGQAIDATRAESILAAAATVRADLAALVPAIPSPAPAPSEPVTEAPDTDGSNSGDESSGDDEAENTDDGDEGNGGNNDKGNNGNKKNKDDE
jgi:hypothetical protein